MGAADHHRTTDHDGAAVQIIGADVYGLDSDGDGVGCESD
jgi:hypothetical protein